MEPLDSDSNKVDSSLLCKGLEHAREQLIEYIQAINLICDE